MVRGVRIHSLFIVGLVWIFLGSLPLSLWAAPSVSSLSGAVSNGAIITITGSGFGATGPNVLLFDDFDSGTNGSTINLSGASGPRVGAWSARGNASTSLIAYSNAYAHSGSLSWMADRYAGSSGCGDGVNIFLQKLLPNVNEIYVSYWNYYPSTFIYPGSASGCTNLKVFWMWDNAAGFGASDIWSVYNTDWAWHWGCSGDAGDCSGRLYLNEPASYPHIILGQWTRWDQYFKGEADSTGISQFWLTDATHARYAVQNVAGKNMANAAHTWDTLNFCAYSRPVSNHNSTSYQDDIYIAYGPGARARVEIGNDANYSKCTNLAVSTPTSWSDTSITATVRQGSFANASSAFLFVFDANGAVNSQGYPIVIGGGSADGVPTISITSPTSEGNYVSSQSAVQIAGSASDDKGVSNVTWSNSRGGNGTAVNNSGTWSSWSTGDITLLEGENIITVMATDTANHSMTDTLTVTYSSGGTARTWSATAQTGDSSWDISWVTYCVRLLVEGSKVTQSGNQIQLGFQGRASGSYTIKKVSIAERDTAGLEGDVVNSTYTKVTFDGKSVSTWATDVITVPAGQEKLSNAMPFALQAGKDYYITFKIESPSVYLDPPSTYRELYFSSADHTDDIDWGQNGHVSIQDYHALSSIYVVAGGGGGVGPTPPGNLKIK
jgi:hypothetical protein